MSNLRPSLTILEDFQPIVLPAIALMLRGVGQDVVSLVDDEVNARAEAVLSSPFLLFVEVFRNIASVYPILILIGLQKSEHVPVETFYYNMYWTHNEG